MRIAVIITIYHNREYLIKCLSSIAMQSMASQCNVYCIIDDNLNYDDLFELYKPILNIIVHTNLTNQGCAVNRNIGLALASRDDMDYIYYLDADDTFYGYHSLESLCRKAYETDADIIKGLMLHYITPTETEFMTNENIWTHATLYKLNFIKKNCIHFGSISASEDLVFNFWCNACNPKVESIDSVISVYNYNDNGYNHKNNDAYQYDNMRQQFQNFEYTYSRMKSNPAFSDDQIVDLVREWFMRYYIYVNIEQNPHKLYDMWRALPIFWNLFSHLLDCPIDEYCKINIHTGIMKYSVSEYIEKIKEGYLPSLC